MCVMLNFLQNMLVFTGKRGRIPLDGSTPFRASGCRQTCTSLLSSQKLACLIPFLSRKLKESTYLNGKRGKCFQSNQGKGSSSTCLNVTLRCLLVRCWSQAAPPLLMQLKPCGSLFWDRTPRLLCQRGSAACSTRRCTVQHPHSISSRRNISQMKCLEVNFISWRPFASAERRWYQSERFIHLDKSVLNLQV